MYAWSNNAWFSGGRVGPLLWTLLVDDDMSVLWMSHTGPGVALTIETPRAQR